MPASRRKKRVYFPLDILCSKLLQILKYFHIQTSAIKRKYPTLIVRIFFVSAYTHSISRFIIQQIVTMPIYGKGALNICHPT